MKYKKLPSLQFVITNRLSLISHLNSNDRSIPLKVPQRENYLLSFFTLSDPIWVVDIKTAKNRQVLGNQNKTFNLGQNLKVGGGCLWAYMYAYNVFFEKFHVLVRL
jgi:hypothetical protein